MSMETNQTDPVFIGVHLRRTDIKGLLLDKYGHSGLGVRWYKRAIQRMRQELQRNDVSTQRFLVR